MRQKTKIKKKKNIIKDLMANIEKNKNSIKKKINKIKNSYKFYSKIFDKLYKENLLYIYDSFKEILPKYLVIVNKKIWDIRILLDLWGNLLCSTEMQNPSPVFPHDPFTKKNLEINDINNILQNLKKNGLEIYSPLKYLLLNYDKINGIYSDIKIPEFGNSQELSRMIVYILKDKFRFRLINKKNSQDNYTGIWVNNDIPFSDFEIFFDYYDKMSMQIQTAFGDIVENYEKIQLKILLDKYPTENININIFNEKF